MVPTTVAGVLIFVASVGPGYVYVKVIERWRPYVQRTSFRETAEIVVAGSIATIIGVVVTLIVAKATGVVNVKALIDSPRDYLTTHPNRLAWGLLILFGVSYGLAWIGPRVLPGKGAKVFPDSGWYAAFERHRPEQSAISATVELRDGRKVTGLIRAFTAEQVPVDEREMTLQKSPIDRMRVTIPGQAEEVELTDEMVVLRGSEIVAISASYVSADGASPVSAKKGWRVRFSVGLGRHEWGFGR